MEVDAETGYRLPPRYPGARRTVTRVYVQWPARVATWLESNGYTVDRLPPLPPDWQVPSTGAPPSVRSPSLDCAYRLREGVPPEYQKICFEASAGNDVRRLYWFLDGLLIGAVKPGEKLFHVPAPGRHRVVCQDDQGRTTEFTLVVEGAEG